MRVLVTGGAGFIGSHLAGRLLREGHEIAILDDLNDFYSPALKRENLAALEGAQAVRFYEGDIRDEDLVGRIFAENRPEAVVHLAARAGVRPSLDQALLYESVNVRGTMVLLEASRKYGVRNFLFASSSSIYGEASRVPFREDDWDTLPISPYAATKMAGEKIAYTYSHLYRLPVVCLRFFTVYGPRQRPDLAIRKFTEAISMGRPITLFGDGSTSRDYTYVDDTVEGIRNALNYETSYDIINLGNSNPVDLLTLVRLIEENLGRKADINWLPMQPGDVSTTYADITKAKRLIGYNPQTPIAEGIRKFVAWRLREKG